ncbi:polysaccharide deacetylase family protein [Alkalihalobacillus deserti]|uniref:polysaccharide deacetylase family protein n=1 Tax=Alkalihalobacillus deserti TaxID=2879466 RepID=UPI001D156289|nr:polysaccharide deacetylase family protein [Alkalihalobacillus deserti]
MYNSSEENIITNLKQREKKGILLTFDDGPSKYINRFLDILAEEEVTGLFFWQSRLLHHKRPWERLLEDGHMIGAHSHSHPNLTNLDFNQQMNEIQKSKQMIEGITGQSVRYFRPPFGQYNQDTLEVLAKLELEMVMWDISSFDWNLKQEPNQIIENVMNHVQDGSILLLHELEQTLQILPTLIKKLKEKGCHFSRL